MFDSKMLTEDGVPAVTLEAAIAALDPVVALLSLVQITGDRALLHRYGPALEGTQDKTREAFVATEGQLARNEADQGVAGEVRLQLLKAVREGRKPRLPDIDPALFRQMSRLALGLDLPEASLPVGYQHAGFTTDTRVRAAQRVPPEGFKVLVVGAGMIGINAAVKLRQAGFEFQIIEALPDVGGTWLVNTYPGAAVDTPSRVYSFSFAHNASWTKHYPRGPEFLTYLNQVVDEYGIRERIDFNTEVDGAVWDETRHIWTVTATRNGQTVRYDANALFLAAGPNNGPKFPNVKNLDTFEGPLLHSAVWDNTVDLRGKHVVLVGTGCSGVQVASAIADTVASMTIIQRQPEHIIPNPLVHADVDILERWAMENIPFVKNWIRLQALSSALQDMRGMLTIDPEHHARTGGVSPLNDAIRDMCLNYLKSHFRDDPEMVSRLTPNFPVFAKRPILDCGFYDTLKKPHVTLVTGALAACEKDAVFLTDGTRIPCDALLLSTGYQKHEGTQFDIQGRGGKTLQDAFTPAPFAYNGMLVPDFPNFAILAGPYSRLVANHAVVGEQHVHYLIELLQTMIDEDYGAIDVREAACRDWVAEVDAGLSRTTWGKLRRRPWLLPAPERQGYHGDPLA